MNKRENTNKFISGSLVGLANTAIFYPIDVIRVRTFFRKERLVGNSTHTLFNGLYFTLWTGCLRNMATYPTQEILCETIKSHGQYSEGQAQFYSGLITGSLIGLIGNPINSVKVPMQASKTKISSWMVARNIYQNYGIGGFYRGGVGIFLRDMSWAGVYFPAYQYLNQKLNNHHLPSSLLAGGMSMMVAYPFDGMRLYRQHHLNDYNLWHGFRESFRWNGHNLKSFMVGFTRVPLSVTFCHLSYLYICDWLNN